MLNINKSKVAQHVQLVQGVVTGRRPLAQTRVMISDSWLRCLSSHKLTPDQNREPQIVSDTDLRERRERSQPLYSIARIEMAGLVQLLNAPVGVMLTDDQGVILGYCGAANFAEVANASGLREGAVWSEAEQGTNGMGTCLTSREAVLIEEDEHFLCRNSALTCCGAPIRDGVGRVIGAINISGQLRWSAAPTLALVRRAVKDIQDRMLVTGNRQHHLLRFHPQREFVATTGEGILVIDGRGVIVGVNPGALTWLGLSGHLDLCGKSAEQVFGVGLDKLAAMGSSAPVALPFPGRARGAQWFGIVEPPRISDLPRGRQGASRRNALVEAERSALRQVLDNCRWNVSLAAAQLDMSRRTLHRKLKAHDLRRHAVRGANSDSADMERAAI